MKSVRSFLFQLAAILVFACPAFAKPDLVVTDIWVDGGGAIWVQIMNQGEDNCDPGHTVALYVDSNRLDSVVVGAGMAPNQRLSGPFPQYYFNCSGSSGIVEVVADDIGVIVESDENNNNRLETWKCDSTAPQITSGPTVSNITQSSAKISWNTNESSDSLVKYSELAIVYDQNESNGSLSTDHEINLNSLTPSTTYHFLVQSADASGNVVASGDSYFTTLAKADSIDPNITFFASTGRRLPMEFTAAATDNYDVERVEFRLDGVLIETDYSYPFRMLLDPLGLGMEPNEYYTSHVIAASAFDWIGRDHTSTMNYERTPICYPAELDFNSPYDGYEVIIAGATVPPGEWPIRVVVNTSETPWETHTDHWGYDLEIDVIQGEPVDKIELYINDVLEHTEYNTTLLDYDWPIVGLGLGDYEVKVKSYTDSNCIPRAQTNTVTVTNVYSDLHIGSRGVSRHGNYFTVSVAIRNTGYVAAEVKSFRDSFTGFQIDDSNAMGAFYDPGTRRTEIYKKFGPGEKVIPAFSTGHVSYTMVPVMYQGWDEYSVGLDPVRITWEDTNGVTVVEEATMPREGAWFEEDVDEAFETSDYLMVTSPQALFLRHDHNDVQDLLSKMAELAILRDAVLAYFQTHSLLRSRFYSSSRITVGNIFGEVWDEELYLADEDDDLIRCYNATDELTIETDEQLPIRRGGLAPGDGFAVGNIFDTSGAHPQNEIIVANSGHAGGDWPGRVEYYTYSFGSSSFSKWHIDTDYDPGDGFVAGDVMADTATFDRDEMLVANEDGTIDIYYNNTDGSRTSFASVFTHGDHFVTGHIMGDSREEIIVGDVSANSFVIYDDSGTELLSYTLPGGVITLDDEDSISVGNVMGGGAGRIIIASYSLDRILIYSYVDLLDTLSYVGGFDLELDDDDKVLAGDILGTGEDQIIVCRGTASNHYAKGDIEIFPYSRFGDQPGDRHVLNELVSCDEEWARKLDPNWCSEGFLLFVGEIEIIPAFACSYEISRSRKRIEYTDNHYANTSGELKKPELAMGRIIGNTIERLIKPIQASIDIINGDHDFDKSNALVVSGRNAGVGGADWINFTLERYDVRDQMEGKGYTVTNKEDPSDSEIFDSARNKDAIHLAGHGSAFSWDVLDYNEVKTEFDPCDCRPLVYGSSCLTGRYPEGKNTMAESFLYRGASAYIGATEIAYFPYGKYLAEGFWGRFNVGTPAGKALKGSKRNRMGDTNYAKYNSAIFHLYGDPKLEPVIGGGAKTALAEKQSSATEESIQGPLSSIGVNIPDYNVVTSEGLDYVSIPGGSELLEPNQPEVPTYTVYIEYPAGYRVQDVTMTEKGDMSTATGLDIPLVEPAVMAESAESGGNPPQDPNWWPQGEYDWTIITEPNNITTLAITIYPFYYNAATTNVEYYQSYNFDIDYVTSPVTIKQFKTDKDIYRLGDQISCDLYMISSGQQGMDLLVETVMKSTDGAVVHGQTIRRLSNVQGLVSCSETWDSTNYSADSYMVEVNVRQTDGTLLDRRVRYFTLGVASVKVDSFAAQPQCFQVGEQVSILATLENTGDYAVSGCMFIEVQDANGSTLIEFDEDVNDLSPNASANISKTWDSATASTARCKIVAYFVYDGKSTPINVYPQRYANKNGDLDNDGIVSMLDFAMLADAYFGYNILADIAPAEGDCLVDARDLKVLIDHWLMSED